MSELAVTPEILNPVTGELVPTSDLPRVAVAIDTIREYKRTLDDAVAAFTAAAAEHSARLGTRTLTAGNLEITLSADTSIEWDVEMLGAELRAAGLPEERINTLLVATVTYKVDGRVVRQLEGASPAYAEIIGRARTRVPKRVYASVKRA